MKFFYIDVKKNKDGINMIHHRECDFLPQIGEREYVGIFSSPKTALKKAIHAFPNAALCLHCSRTAIYGSASSSKSDTNS